MSISLRRCLNEIKQEITEEVQEMLDIFESMEKKVENKTQNDKNFQEKIDRLLETSLTREIKDRVLLSVEKQKNKMLMLEKEKASNDSKDIQATMEQRIKILKNDFKKLKLNTMTKLSDENQFNSIKATRIQHQQEVNELIEHVNQKKYAYADMHAKNQDLLITISELKVKLAKQAKNVNTKFEKSATLEKLVCVTTLNKNKDLKSTTISKVQIKIDKAKPVTSLSTSDNEQRVACSNSVSRSEFKDTNLKKRVLLNTKSNRTSKNVKKSQSSFTSVANKNETMTSNVSHSKANVLKAKTVNVVHDGSNLVCASCGKDVYLTSHDKCVARYAMSPNSRIKRALFTSLVTAKFSQVGATPVVAKSRFIIAKLPKATNEVSSVSPTTLEFRQSQTLSAYMKNKIRNSRKWQKWFEHQSSFNWSPKSSTTQTPPSDSKSSTSGRP
ncbi:hypothetical protein Tco_1422422 [Tanacetum coccineum]